MLFFIFDSVASIPCYSASFGKTEVGIVILFVFFSVKSERWSTIKVSLFGKLLQVCIIVKFCIPSYPGPSKECGTEVRLTQGKISHGKIQMYLQLYVRNYNFKTIPVKEMEPNFIRMKVPELKKYLQLRGLGVAIKHNKELLDFVCKSSQTCH